MCVFVLPLLLFLCPLLLLPPAYPRGMEPRSWSDLSPGSDPGSVVQDTFRLEFGAGIGWNCWFQVNVWSVQQVRLPSTSASARFGWAVLFNDVTGYWAVTNKVGWVNWFRLFSWGQFDLVLFLWGCGGWRFGLFFRQPDWSRCGSFSYFAFLSWFIPNISWIFWSKGLL